MRSPEALPGALAPPLKLDLVGGGFWELSRETPDTFTLLVFYRGFHSPSCRTYLEQLAEIYQELVGLGVHPMAASMDELEEAKRAAQTWKVGQLPIAYSLDEPTAKSWGLFISEAGERRFSEPGLFLVLPDRSIHSTAIASMPFGRPDWNAVLEGIRWLIDEEVPPFGSVGIDAVEPVASL